LHTFAVDLKENSRVTEGQNDTPTFHMGPLNSTTTLIIAVG